MGQIFVAFSEYLNFTQKNLNIFSQNVDRTFGESGIFFKSVIRKVSKIMKKSDQKRN